MEKENQSLSVEQQQELKPIITQLVQEYKPERIICYGWINDSSKASCCFSRERKNIYTQYYLLLVIESQWFQKDSELNTDKLIDLFNVSIIVQNRAYAEKAITKGNRFYVTAYRDGSLLYPAENLVNHPKLPSIDQRRTLKKAEKNYNHRFYLAKGFLEEAKSSMKFSKYNVAVNLLHHAVEQSSIASIRVFMAYNPSTNDISKLINLTLCFSEDALMSFPCLTSEDERIFKLLMENHTALKNNIGQYEALFLLKPVTDFVNHNDNLCLEKIKSYREEALESKNASQAFSYRNNMKSNIQTPDS